MKKILSYLKWYEYLFLLSSITIVIIMSIIFKISPLETISTCFGLFASFLNSKSNKNCFFFYVIYVALYGIVAFNAKQYGEGIINLFYNVPLYLFTLYKLFLCKKIKITKEFIFKRRYYIYSILVLILITIIYGLILDNLFHSSLPYLNALATGFAILSSFFASKRVIEQWGYWICYSIVLLIIWFINFNNSNAGITYLFLNFFFIAIDIYGIITWSKERKFKNENFKN